MKYIINIADFVSLLAILTALIVLCKGWGRALRADARILLAGFLGLTLFYNFSNVLEWTGITARLDPLEDYIETLGPVLWIFFFYAFLK